MKKLFFLLPAALLAACGGEGPKASQKFPGYYEGAEGAIYQVHSLGETGRKPIENDWLELKMTSVLGDSTVYDSELESAKGTLLVPYASSKYYGVLSEGDSATFLLPAGDFTYGSKDSMMRTSVKLVKIYSEAEHTAMEKAPAKNDPELDEQKFIQPYLRKKHISATADPSGLYILSSTPGTGPAPVKGDSIVTQYTFWTPNGKLFDVPERHKEGVTFSFGDQDQMLPGFALAVARMKAGGKMRVLVPSSLAFGKEGSSNGLIKPYTPVIFDVELLRVQPKS